MRIDCLEIDGYGVWSGLRVERVSEGLNVVYGPNEAGKSTLLQFIRTVLYGFSPERRRYLPPVHGGRPGGFLEVVTPGGHFQIARHTTLDAEAGHGPVSVSMADGTRQGEYMLKTLLSNLDEATFNNVFAVGLHEMQELGTLGDSQAAELLYNISAGMDRVSLGEVMRELGAMRNRLLDREGGPSQIVQLLGRREQLRQEIETLQAQGQQHVRLAGDRARIEHDVVRLEEEKERAQQQVRTIELAASLRERWQRRAALRGELDALGPQSPIPPDAAARLDAIHERLHKYEQQVAEFERHGEKLRHEQAELKLNEALGDNAARIDALMEQEPWINTIHGQIVTLEKERTEVRAALIAEHEQLGLTKPVDPEKAPPISAKAIERLRTHARAMREYQRPLKQTQNELTAAQRAASSVGQQIEEAMRARNVQSLPAAIDHAGQLVNQLRRRIQLDERLDQLVRNQDELREQSAALTEGQVMPMPIIVIFGLIFVLSLVLVFVAMFLPALISGATAWVLALIGLGGMLATVLVRGFMQRSNNEQFDASRKQLHTLQAQTKQAKDERDMIDAHLPHGGGPMVARLAAAEKELAALEQLAPLQNRHAAARHDAATADQRAEQVEQQLRAARRAWRDGLSELDLPEKMHPRHLKNIALRSRRIRQFQERLRQIDDELDHRRHDFEMLVGRIGQLVADCGCEPSTKQPLEQLHELSEALGRQDAQLSHRDEIQRKLRQLRRHCGKHEEAIARLKHRRQTLLREAGCEDEPEFRRRAAEAARTESLRQSHDALDRELAAAIGDRCSLDAIRQQLDGGAAAQIESRLAEAQGRLAAVEKELHDRIEKRGQLSQQLKSLIADRHLAGKYLDLSMVEKQLDDALRHWQVLAVTGHLLEAVRASYETKRQPETLLEASGYLERMTQGKYPRVWTPLGEQVLKIDDAQGHSLPVEVLSRGTREQLFLSLRMALAALYARRGAALPLVLDDVLVNFDTERAKATAGVLCDFAAGGHQLLIFTCHEHIAELFHVLQAPVLDLPDNSAGGHTTISFEEPPKEKESPKEKEKPKRAGKSKPPKSRPPEPEPEPESDEESLDEEADSAAAEETPPWVEPEPMVETYSGWEEEPLPGDERYNDAGAAA